MFQVLRIGVGKKFALGAELLPEFLVAVRRMQDFLDLPDVTPPNETRSACSATSVNGEYENANDTSFNDLRKTRTSRSGPRVDAECGSSHNASFYNGGFHDASSPLLQLEDASFAWPSTTDEDGAEAFADDHGEALAMDNRRVPPTGEDGGVAPTERESSLLPSDRDSKADTVITDDNASVGIRSDMTGSSTDSRVQRDTAPFALTRLNLTLHAGELVAVTGAVGSGKSSLFQALAGELVHVGGSVATWPRSVAYASQTPWIFAGSLKENVVFGAPLDESRYRAALAACALEEDIAQLPDGEDTEIGEKVRMH